MELNHIWNMKNVCKTFILAAMIYSFQKEEGISRGKLVSESKINYSEQNLHMWDCKMILGLTNPEWYQFNHKKSVSSLLRFCTVSVSWTQAPEWLRSLTDFWWRCVYFLSKITAWIFCCLLCAVLGFCRIGFLLVAASCSLGYFLWRLKMT